MNQTKAEDVKHLAKPNNAVLEKLGWKWKPEVNQTVLYDKKLMFIVSVGKTRVTLLPFDIPDFGEPLCHYVVYTSEIIDVIPILEWEEIEKVLEGVRYPVHIDKIWVEPKYGPACHYKCSIELNSGSSELETSYYGSRTRAAYEAVIALGKKLGEEINAKSK